MNTTTKIVAPPSKQTVETIRGQHHKFMLIPLIERHSVWFEAGLVSIAVEARALGESKDRMVRGPSIHVFNAERSEEYIRFDVFGNVLHYHYILNAAQHNILWGYDADVNGPMIDWAAKALKERLPAMLRRCMAQRLATQVEEQGWATSVLPAVQKAAYEALVARDDDLERAREGMEWMREWKQVHPQFNTVEPGEY